MCQTQTHLIVFPPVTAALTGLDRLTANLVPNWDRAERPAAPAVGRDWPAGSPIQGCGGREGGPGKDARDARGSAPAGPGTVAAGTELIVVEIGRLCFYEAQ